MILEDWLRSTPNDKALLDVVVQIMERYIFNGEGKGCLRAENYDINVFEGEENQLFKYGDVSFEKRFDSYSADIYPVPAIDNSGDSSEVEKGDVFCLGIMLYKIYNNELPELEEAEMLLNNLGEKKLPFLTPKSKRDNDTNSIVCRLITEMTDLNTNTRCTMKECLKMIIDHLPSSCCINLTEKATFDIKERINVPLKEIVTSWYVQNHYSISGKGYIPEKLEECLEIYYRIYEKQTMTVFIVSDKLACPERWPVPQLSENLSIGIDFGTWSSSVSYVNDNGYTEDIMFGETPYVPTAICYAGRDECIFGHEAIEKGNTYPAALAKCFKRRIENNEIFRINAINGEIVEECYFDAVVRFLGYLYSVCKEKFGERLEMASVVLTVPACYDAGMKTAIVTAAEKAGFSPVLLSEPEAAAFFFGMRNSSSGNALVLDIGGGTTDVCLLDCSSESKEEIPQIKSRYVGGIGQLGGIDFTQLIVSRIMEDTIRRKYAVDFSSGEIEGLSPAQVEENKRRLENEAEKAKILLSTSDKVTCTANLYFPRELEEREVEFVCKRAHYENIIKENVELLRKQLKKTIASKGLNLQKISNFIITGGGSVTPAVRKMVIDLFSETECDIHYVDYYTVVSRGAAIFANELGIKSGNEQSLSETNYDIGTVNAAPFSGREVFSCLIKAGTEFNSGDLTASFICNLTEDEKLARYCRVLLYKRPREYSHVESPLDANGGDYIRPVGSLFVSDFPEEFNAEAGKIMFRISLNPQERISCVVHFYTRTKKTLFKQAEDILLDSRSAVFIPLNEKQS